MKINVPVFVTLKMILFIEVTFTVLSLFTPFGKDLILLKVTTTPANRPIS